jgi:hypothetical protein
VTFKFSFDRLPRALALPFGTTPSTTGVDMKDGQLLAGFGPRRFLTPLENAEGSQVTGPYATLLVIGPARLSIADRGLNFATNARRGLCIRFRQPVRGIEPTGRLRHPALTVTVADVDGLAAALVGDDG